MSSAAALCDIAGPAPVESKILVHRPYIRIADSLCKLLLHYHFLGADVLYTQDSQHIGSVFLYYFHGTAVEVRYLLMIRSLAELEPISRSLVIYSQEEPAEAFQILAYSGKVFVGNKGVYSEGQGHVLTVPAYIPHKRKGLAVGAATYTAEIGKIVIIGVVPLELHFLILVYLRNTPRKFFIKRVIAVHEAYAAVRSAQFAEDIILTDILTSFASVAEIHSA